MDLSPDNTFTLLYPAKHKGNILKPKIGELILIHQKINDVPYFTHIVTLTDNVLEENSNFRYGRQVKIVAVADITNPIAVHSTKWASIRLRGIVQGNACRIENIKNIGNIAELQLDIWNRFSIV